MTKLELSARRPATLQVPGDGDKRTALFISTLGMLMATIDGSITLIALPDIFRGIGIDPLEAGNSFYLLWMILGFLVVTSVLVTTLGRMGDIYGRVRIYNLGFALFTFFSLLLSITWLTGDAAGIWLIVLRIFQGVAAAMSGMFIGLVLGGILAPINWRLIFLVSDRLHARPNFHWRPYPSAYL